VPQELHSWTQTKKRHQTTRTAQHKQQTQQTTQSTTRLKLLPPSCGSRCHSRTCTLALASVVVVNFAHTNTHTLNRITRPPARLYTAGQSNNTPVSHLLCYLSPSSPHIPLSLSLSLSLYLSPPNISLHQQSTIVGSLPDKRVCHITITITITIPKQTTH